MSNLAVVQGKLDRLEDERKKVREEWRDIIRRSFINCTKCGKQSGLFSWTFIQDQYYIEPYSCTSGDYWLNSKTECCHVVCPKCGEEIYLYNHPRRDKIVELVDSRHFGKSELFQKVEERARR